MLCVARTFLIRTGRKRQTDQQSVCKPGSVLLFLKKPNHPFFIKEVSVIYLSRMSPYKL